MNVASEVTPNETHSHGFVLYNRQPNGKSPFREGTSVLEFENLITPRVRKGVQLPHNRADAGWAIFKGHDDIEGILFEMKIRLRNCIRRS